MQPEPALPLFAEPEAATQPRPQQGVAHEPPPPTAIHRSGQRKTAWLALHFPEWPMTAVLSGVTAEQRAHWQAKPFAVVDVDRKRRVLVCNEPARRHGLRPGHSLNAAIALCGGLEVALRNLEQEAALLETTARSCQRYTSTVSLEPPNELLLEVRGSFRLFGGVQSLMQAVLDGFAAKGIAVNAALTPTARSALWLSRDAQSPRIIQPRALPAALGSLPITVLYWSPEIAERLTRFGVRSLGDLRRLPRSGLARRIGIQQSSELDAALGKRPEIRHTVPELPRYFDRVVLDGEIETTGLLEPLIAARLVVLERFLIARTLALSELTLHLMHRAHPVTVLCIGLALPATDMGHLHTLIHERLGSLQLPAPIVELRLRAVNLVPATCRSRHLFQASAENGEGLQPRLARLLETLESRLGRQAVTALHVVADHRPEAAQSRNDIAPASSSRSSGDCRIPDCLPQRPLWLLPEVMPLAVAECTLVSGPEHIATGWWDGVPCRRDYFIALDRKGILCWIFRDQAGRWYLHGRFG